jgi:hypothetical protein
MKDSQRRAMWARLNSKCVPLHVIQRKNMEKGKYFFSPDTTRFFKSQYPKGGYSDDGKVYFITSEKFEDRRNNIIMPRKFTLREADLESGDVDTAKGTAFQQFPSKQEAMQELKKRVLK